MLIKFWGVHGSLPRPGPSTLKFGGNTPCVEVREGDTLIILDAGSGIRELGEDLTKRDRTEEGKSPSVTGHVLISHYHWDHIHGFPFFDPIYSPDNEFHLYGINELEANIGRVLSEVMNETNFPVPADQLPCKLVFHDLEPGDSFLVDKVRIRAERLLHPGGGLAYRLESPAGTVVYASDTEHMAELDDVMVKLAQGADILIYDGMFAPDQYLGLWDNVSRRSWGHSTWEAGLEIARSAHIKKLILFHHGNDDATVRRLEEEAQRVFPETFAAYEGMTLEL